MGFRKLHAIEALVLLLCGVSSTNVRAANSSQSKELVSDKKFRKEFVFTVGDQVEVFVRRDPEVSRTVTIRPDGYLTLPLVDSVQAAGLTPIELKARLTEVLARRFINPEVNVIAVQTRPPTVYVTGEVVTTTAVPLRTSLTAAEAIASAGGLRHSAAVRSIYVIRLGEDERMHAIPIGAPPKGQVGPYLALANLFLQPDDIVFVPENRRSRVNRFIDDIINRPLTGINSLLSVYLNFRLIELYSRITP
jgi:polysaccharide export outer membrane protein